MIVFIYKLKVLRFRRKIAFVLGWPKCWGGPYKAQACTRTITCFLKRKKKSKKFEVIIFVGVIALVRRNNTSPVQ